uniref:Uncharacterized protein n=1 Tax=Globisporangium ultimum (strain ATCC 200006 / CBS 805.95 / DAOM BR144) TaxID=431595 RepID=K3WXN0_GLOUD
MPPGNASFTPNPVNDYDVIKTPGASNSERRFGASPWSAKFWYLGILAQLVIVSAVVVYVYGQIAYFAPSYSATLD